MTYGRMPTAIIICLPALATCLLAAGPGNASDDTLALVNGARLRGELVDAGATIGWRTALAAEPLSIPRARVAFVALDTLPGAAHPVHFALKNGEGMVAAALAGLDREQAGATIFDQEISIPRKHLNQVVFIPEDRPPAWLSPPGWKVGPAGEAHPLFRGDACDGAWTASPGRLRLACGGIRASVVPAGLPGDFTLVFEARWEEGLDFTLHLLAGAGDEEPQDGVIASFSGQAARIGRADASEVFVADDIIEQNLAVVAIAVWRSLGKARLSINGQPSAQVGFRAAGEQLALRTGHPLELRGLCALPAILTNQQSPQASRDRIWLHDGTLLHGANLILTAEHVMLDNPTLGQVLVPRAKVAGFLVATDEETWLGEEGDTPIILANGDRVRLQRPDYENGMLTGRHPVLGRISIPRSAIRIIQFNQASGAPLPGLLDPDEGVDQNFKQ